MKSLLLVAHGSRRQASNDEVRELTERLRQLGGEFELVDCGFLELAEPSIPDSLRALIQAGSKEIVVLPYFLSAGRHVVTDVPEEVELVRKEYPDVSIQLAPYLGAAAGIASMLMSQAALVANA